MDTNLNNMSCKTCENSTAGFCPDCFETVRTNSPSIEKILEDFVIKFSDKKLIGVERFEDVELRAKTLEVISFLRTSLEEYGREVKEIPYSVSEWKKIGIKRGYWGYFEKEVIDKCIEALPEEDSLPANTEENLHLMILSISKNDTIRIAREKLNNLK